MMAYRQQRRSSCGCWLLASPIIFFGFLSIIFSFNKLRKNKAIVSARLVAVMPPLEGKAFDLNHLASGDIPKKAFLNHQMTFHVPSGTIDVPIGVPLDVVSYTDGKLTIRVDSSAIEVPVEATSLAWLGWHEKPHNGQWIRLGFR